MTVITLGFFQTLAIAFAVLAGGWKGAAVLLASELVFIVLGMGGLLVLEWSEKRNREDQR